MQPGGVSFYIPQKEKKENSELGCVSVLGVLCVVFRGCGDHY